MILETKTKLISFYSDCIAEKHHRMKRIGDEYGIHRKKVEKAHELGKKLFNRQKIVETCYLDQKYNWGEV